MPEVILPELLLYTVLATETDFVACRRDQKASLRGRREDETRLQIEIACLRGSDMNVL